MALKKFVVGCFEDEKVLFPAVAKVRKAGYKFHDLYTPFPNHNSRNFHDLGLYERLAC